MGYMDNIDKLIAGLKAAKEELSKGAMPNQSDSGSETNKSDDIKDVGNGKMVIGRSPSPKQVDKEMRAIAEKNDNEQPPIVDKKHKQSPMDSKLPVAERVIQKGESCHVAKNGQWSLKDLEKASVDPKLAPKDAKVKELQSKIDSKTYKPDASKIADKMISHPKRPLK